MRNKIVREWVDKAEQDYERSISLSKNVQNLFLMLFVFIVNNALKNI